MEQDSKYCIDSARDVWMGGISPTIYSNSQESWSTVGHAARELLATVFSVTLFFSNNSWSIGQNAPLNNRGLSTSMDSANANLETMP